MIEIIDIEGEYFFFDLRDITMVRARQIGEIEGDNFPHFEVTFYFVEIVELTTLDLKIGWNNFNELKRKLIWYAPSVE